MTDTIAIVSGGLDSVTLLHYLCKQENKMPTVLTFTYGQKHSKEVDFARYHTQLLGCTDHQVVDISFLAGAFGQSALVSSQVVNQDFSFHFLHDDAGLPRMGSHGAFHGGV